jgi:hypothetical protein
MTCLSVRIMLVFVCFSVILLNSFIATCCYVPCAHMARWNCGLKCVGWLLLCRLHKKNFCVLSTAAWELAANLAVIPLSSSFITLIATSQFIFPHLMKPLAISQCLFPHLMKPLAYGFQVIGPCSFSWKHLLLLANVSFCCHLNQESCSSLVFLHSIGDNVCGHSLVHRASSPRSVGTCRCTERRH